MLGRILGAMVVCVATLACSAPAHASFAFESDDAVWVAADDGSLPTRLAAGREPHLVPGGATVLYRSRSGSRLYAVPSTGGPSTLLHTLRVKQDRRIALAVFPLPMQFSADGRRVLIPVLDQVTLLVDLTTRTVQTLAIPGGAGALSPDGDRVAWIRGRRSCRLAVLNLAVGRVRRVARVRCATQTTWGERGIALAWEDRSGTHVSVIDPSTGAARRLFTAPRVLDLAGASGSGAWRILALADAHHQLAAWLVLPDGRLIMRPLGRVVRDPVFSADDRSVLVARPDGTVVRIELATGGRQRVGATDGSLSAD